MIEIIKQQQIQEDDWGWIQMRSPVLHSEPYGTLAVFTDGLMHPGKGFDMHPHRNLEIVSVILEGEVTHRDSTGNVTKMPAGSVQRITAGSGIYHAEHTTSKEAVRMYQIWFAPHSKDLTPEYVRTSYDDILQKNKLYPLVGKNGALSMHADGSIYIGHFDEGQTETYNLTGGRKLFAFVANGRLSINNQILGYQDHARIHDETDVMLRAEQETHFILIDVPMTDQRLY